MVQSPDELSHKTKQNSITHNITRGHDLLRNNKKYPPRSSTPPPHHHDLHHHPTVASVKLIQVSETLFFFY